MAKTRTEILTMASQVLNDTGTAIWGTAELHLLVDDALVEIADYKPYEKKETISTVAGTKDIDISGIINLIEIDKVEWKVDKSPQQLRNHSRWGGIITLDVETKPSAVEDAYLYCQKIHTLLDPPSSLAGAVNKSGGYSSGATAIILDGLGVGTILTDTLVEFAGINGEYKTVAASTIAGNAATVTITPGLLEDMANDAVVSFKCTTLDQRLERVLPDLVAARACTNLTTYQINKISVGGETTPERYQAQGRNLLALTLPKLEAMRTPRMYLRYPTS